MAFTDTVILHMGLPRTPADIKAIRQRALQIKRYLAKRDTLTATELEEEAERLALEAASIIESKGLTARTGSIH